MTVAEIKSHSSLEDSTTTFWLSTTSDSEKTLSEVPKIAGFDPSRQRRAHRKSKGGCENCKKRRVKCNEETPCANCVRRGQQCRRIRYNRPIAIPPTPTNAPLLELKSRESDVDLLHLKLYHHFQTCTIPTLLFPPEVWEQSLQLSFQFDFLANTILCVSARHLSVLLPEDTSYSTTAAAHLGRALSQFRHKLSGDFKSTHIDAFIATSLLLQYEIWTSTDDYSLPQDSSLSFDMPRDRIFAFCSSLKKMFLNCVPIICVQPSVFMPYIRHDSRASLIKTYQISNNTLIAYQTHFSYERPLGASSFNPRITHTRGTNLVTFEQWQNSTPKTQGVANLIDECYKPIITELCLILSFLPEAQSPGPVSKRLPQFPELVKHILSFPVICHGPFNSMIQQGDHHALLLLFHFYRAVRILIPENEFWWVHKRAKVSEVALKDWLMRQIIEQVDKETTKSSHAIKVS